MTSVDRDQYFGSDFVKECEQAVRGKEISSVISRSLIQGHLMLCIVLHNAQLRLPTYVWTILETQKECQEEAGLPK